MSVERHNQPLTEAEIIQQFGASYWLDLKPIPTVIDATAADKINFILQYNSEHARANGTPLTGCF